MMFAFEKIRKYRIFQWFCSLFPTAFAYEILRQHKKRQLQEYKRLLVISVEEGSKLIGQPKYAFKTSDGEYIIRMSSERLKLMKRQPECQCCEIKATHFVLEKIGEQIHFNLFAKTSDGEIMLTMDHINPKAKGGTNKPSNLQTLCKKCNHLKADHIIDLKKLKELRNHGVKHINKECMCVESCASTKNGKLPAEFIEFYVDYSTISLYHALTYSALIGFRIDNKTFDAIVSPIMHQSIYDFFVQLKKETLPPKKLSGFNSAKKARRSFKEYVISDHILNKTQNLPLQDKPVIV